MKAMRLFRGLSSSVPSGRHRPQVLHARALLFILLAVLILLIGLGTVTYLTRQETQMTPQAQETARLRVMTYNLHGSYSDRKDLGRTDAEITTELKEVAAFIKQQQLDIVALQELNRVWAFGDLKIIMDELNHINYPMYVTESVHKNNWDNNSSFGALLHKSPSLEKTSSPRKELPSTKGGTEPYFGSTTSLLNTPFGRVRVFQHHPLPRISVPAADELLQYVDSFQDGVPALILADTNLFFDQPDHSQHGPVIAKILQKFIKACDKTIFPNNHCHSTVATAKNRNWEIDQILIDKRWQVHVVNAWVDTSRDNWPAEHSDHLPVLAVLGPKSLVTTPNCSNLSGPTTLQVGTTGTYTATVSSPQKELRGEIFRNNFQVIRNQWFGAVNTATIQGSWTPTAADIGTHTVHCRAWNDAIAECRPPSLVDGPPRYACAGPNYSMTVTVVPAPSPSPTATPLTQQKFDVSLSASPIRGGTTSGGGQYQHGATATITAQPSNGYRFAGWSEGTQILSAEAIYQFAVTRTRAITATFAPIPSPSPSPTLNRLDVTADGRIDIFDYNMLISDYGKTTPTRSDINSDGVVNSVDVQIFLQGFSN